MSIILQAISSAFDKSDLEIFDNNRVARNAKRWRNLQEFVQQFCVYISKKPRESSTWKPNYWFTFRIHTNLQVRTIRRHQAIFKLLVQYNARLTYALWTDQPKDAYTSAIGFLIGYSPKHCMSDQVIQETDTAIPTWKPTMTTTSVSIDNVVHRNVSYDFTCRTSDATKLRSLLEKTFTKSKFKKTLKFAPYQLKHSHPKLFAQLVDYQADLTNHLVIAIEEVPIEHMRDGFSDVLRKHFPSISAVFEHKNTRTEDLEGKVIGRWNIMCPSSHFDSTAQVMKSKIGTLYKNYTDNPNVAILQHQFYPHVTSKIHMSELTDDNSETTKNSFASFYKTSSVASYQKQSQEETFLDTYPTVFGIQPKVVSYNTHQAASPSSTPSTQQSNKNTTKKLISYAQVVDKSQHQQQDDPALASVSDLTSATETANLRAEIEKMSNEIKILQLENQMIQEKHNAQLQLMQPTDLSPTLEKRLQQIKIQLKNQHHPYQHSYDSANAIRYKGTRPNPYQRTYLDFNNHNKRNLPPHHPHSEITSSPPSKQNDSKSTSRKPNNND